MRWESYGEACGGIYAYQGNTGIAPATTVFSDGQPQYLGAWASLEAFCATGTIATVYLGASYKNDFDTPSLRIDNTSVVKSLTLYPGTSGNVYLGAGALSNTLKVTGAGALTMEGTATIQQKGIVWVTPADQVDAANNGAAARIHASVFSEGTYDGTVNMYFRLPLPYQINGLTVKITEIVFYGYTSGNSPYFNAIYLRTSDLDGTYTDLISYTDDIGNGSSGDTGAVTIYSGSLSLTDYPAIFVIDLAGTGSYTDWRVYGMKITWTT